jgi:hypothetical protein
VNQVEPKPTGRSEAREALKVDESADLVEAVRAAEGDKEAFTEVIASTESGPSGTSPEEPTQSAATSKGKGKETAQYNRQTKFLALDKVLPGRDFIQVCSLN